MTEPTPKYKGKLKPALRMLLPAGYALCGIAAIVLVLGLVRGDWSLINLGGPGFFAASLFAMIVQHVADQKGARI